MNILAFISAFIGVVLMVLTVHYGNKIENRWLRYLAAAAGLVLAVAITGLIPGLLGDHSNETSGLAGTYLVYLIVVAVIVKALFFRKKAEGNEA